MEKRSTVQVLDSDRILLKNHAHGIPMMWMIHALIQAYIENPAIIDSQLAAVGYCRPTKVLSIKTGERVA